LLIPNGPILVSCRMVDEQPMTVKYWTAYHGSDLVVLSGFITLSPDWVDSTYERHPSNSEHRNRINFYYGLSLDSQGANDRCKYQLLVRVLRLWQNKDGYMAGKSWTEGDCDYVVLVTFHALANAVSKYRI